MAKLYFYYSAMNAGKSTTLLQSDYNYRERGMDTILLVPACENRYGASNITSRIGLSAHAIAFEPNFNLLSYVQEQLNLRSDIKCVLVDEAQFLTKMQVRQLSDVADHLNIPVLAYGLRSDFKGEPFEGSLYLLAWAEEIIEIKTICHCGRKATMNVRVDAAGQAVKEGAQIEIGGNERYIAMCHRHFKAAWA